MWVILVTYAIGFACGERLKMQLRLMQGYLDMLDRRIAAFEG
jgi:hypothetical protein